VYSNDFLITTSIILLLIYREVKSLYRYKKLYRNNTSWTKKVNININFKLLRKLINSILMPLFISKIFVIMGFIALYIESSNPNNKLLSLIPILIAVFLADFLFIHLKYLQQKSKLHILCLRKFDAKISNTTKWLILPILEFYGKTHYVQDDYLDKTLLLNEYTNQPELIFSDALYDISSQVPPHMDAKIGEKWIFKENSWKWNVTILINITDICIIDITKLGEGVMWELAIALTHKPDKIILVYDIGKLNIPLNDLYFLIQEKLKKSKELSNIKLLDNILPPIPYEFYWRATDRIIFSYLIYKQINSLIFQVKT